MNYDTKRSGEYIQNRIESGAKGCSVDLFIQLSEFFHVSMDSLILGMDRDNTLKSENTTQLKKEITVLIDHLTTFQTHL